MLSPDMRKRHVLMYEGQALSNTGTHGREAAIELAHCAIDGIMNALIRVEGSEAAARYAFALADRVVGGVREPTALPAIAPPPPAELPKPRSAEPRRMSFWTIFIMGWLLGLVTGATR